MFTYKFEFCVSPNMIITMQGIKEVVKNKAVWKIISIIL